MCGTPTPTATSSMRKYTTASSSIATIYSGNPAIQGRHTQFPAKCLLRPHRRGRSSRSTGPSTRLTRPSPPARPAKTRPVSAPPPRPSAILLPGRDRAYREEHTMPRGPAPTRNIAGATLPTTPVLAPAHQQALALRQTPEDRQLGSAQQKHVGNLRLATREPRTPHPLLHPRLPTLAIFPPPGDASTPPVPIPTFLLSHLPTRPQHPDNKGAQVACAPNSHLPTFDWPPANRARPPLTPWHP